MEKGEPVDHDEITVKFDKETGTVSFVPKQGKTKPLSDVTVEGKDTGKKLEVVIRTRLHMTKQVQYP